MARRVLLSMIAASAALVSSACSDDAQPERSAETTAPVAETTPLPGTCDPADSLPTPTIAIADQPAVAATFGKGNAPCDGVAGDGYIIFNYNPVLIDAPTDAPITITATASSGPADSVDDLVVTVLTSDGAAFTASGDGRWTASARAGCSRVTIDVASASRGAQATFGADIRVGGSSRACPQREVDAFDPSATLAEGQTAGTPPDTSDDIDGESDDSAATTAAPNP